MLRHTSRQSALMLGLLVALAGGCASKTQGEKTVESYSHTRETLSASRRQVALTTSSLTSLRTTPPGAMKDAFRRYRDAVGELEKEAADSKWRAQAMQEQSDAHIQAWKEEMSSIKDPTIKASVESRRDAVGTNFSLIRPENAATGNDVLVLFATGLGQTSSPLNTGRIVPGGPPFFTTQAATITLAGRQITPLYSIAVPGFAGLNQVAFQVPTGIAPGNAALSISVGGVTSNTVNLAIR